MVVNVGALQAGDVSVVEGDIARVVAVCREKAAKCRAIIETALLDDLEKVLACRPAQRAGADSVKTSTGCGPGGASLLEVALMRETVGPDMGVKASDGIRTNSDVPAMIAAGATCIGASPGIDIMTAGRENS